MRINLNHLICSVINSTVYRQTSYLIPKYLQKQDEKSHDIVTIDRFLTATVLPHMKYDFSNYKFHIYKYHIQIYRVIFIISNYRNLFNHVSANVRYSKIKVVISSRNRKLEL